MPDERILRFCTRCGAENPGKNRTCPGCGALLVVTDECPAMAPGNTGTGTGERNPLTTLLVAGGAIVILLIVTLFLRGFFTSLFNQTVVGRFLRDDLQYHRKPGVTGG